MKKLVLITALLVSCFTLTYAQDSIVLHIADYPESREVCIDDHDVFIIYAREEYGFMWSFGGYLPDSWDSPIIISDQLGNYFPIQYTDDGGLNHHFNIRYKESHVPNSFTHTQWKHQAEADSLVAVEADSVGWPAFYQFLWSTGETTRVINVTEDITYTCEISEVCGTAIRTFPVKDNVEIILATCDLGSNLNMLTWPVTARQSEYIDHLRVKRDGIEVGTADYSAGYYIDNIGSDAAARTYTLIAVATDGTECPIESYPKETIHMSYTLGVNNTIEVGWNTPNGYDLLGYNICEYHPGSKDGDLTVIDYVGAGVNNYTCSESQFNEGNIVVQGVEAGKGRNESRLLSNRSWETVGINEQSQQRFEIYPNPATNGIITIKAREELNLTIYNMMGQVIYSGVINGEFTSPRLTPGIYAVQCNGSTQKVVVE